MPYEYRYLEIADYDKHSDPTKRRGGDKPDRYLWVEDSALEDPMFFQDERGDDRVAFLRRARKAFIEYLNGLGAEGWECISYNKVNRVGTSAFGSYSLSSPIGSYLLKRRLGE